ncbi:MAG: (Na+)-NQR maturation NqrM [Gammaproteobacteria bacterium]|nr:MAG: (Na+)-NQR maturation NqrM [Gammaproteobacteria bacterium]
MAIGVILGKKPLKGSCGGVGAALGEKDYVCEICGDDPEKCVETDTAVDNRAKTELGYDASR